MPVTDRAITALFSDRAVPDGLQGAPRFSQYYTRAEMEDLDALAKSVADSVVSGSGLNIHFDNDGTLFPFVSNPKDVAIDPACYAALVRLQALPGVSVMSLTGREVSEVRDLMLSPGLGVTDSRGTVLAQEGQKRLLFKVVGSHGVQCLNPDGPDGSIGSVELYPFSESEKAFIEKFQSAALAFGKDHPDLTVEIKHGAVGVNAATLQGLDEDRRADILSRVLSRLEDILNDPDAPALDGKKIFAVRKEGTREIEVRPVAYGKDFGIRTFGESTPDRTTVFLCDSLGEEGTDTPAAEMVNRMPKGMVFMVRNGRADIPPSDSACAPRAVFANPGMLGRFLEIVADRAEAALRPAPSPFAGMLRDPQIS